MPTDFSALFDTLLVIAGLVLVVTGLVMFIYSKTSTQASSVEAFGIKLNVTHPSLILVLAGVGLMLAPRLLPELPGKETESKPAIAEAPRPESAPPAPAEAAPAVAPAAPQAPAARPAEPVAGAPATATRPTPPTGPIPVPYPNQAARSLPASAAVAEAARSAVKPPPAKKPAAPPATAPSPTTLAAAAKPPPASTPARSTLVYAALGLPISRDFWSGETRASYTARMHDVLQQAGRDALRMDPRSLQLGEKAFDAWWNESNARPKSRELCAASPAPAALLSARVETPTTISSVESAYWPELKLRLYVCATQRIHRQQKSLAPQNDDTWPFSVELNNEVERFLRSTRNDLAAD